MFFFTNHYRIIAVMQHNNSTINNISDIRNRKKCALASHNQNIGRKTTIIKFIQKSSFQRCQKYQEADYVATKSDQAKHTHTHARISAKNDE